MGMSQFYFYAAILKLNSGLISKGSEGPSTRPREGLYPCTPLGNYTRSAVAKHMWSGQATLLGTLHSWRAPLGPFIIL